MNAKEMVELTNYIVQQYYKNNIRPFLEHVDEKVLWYGPAKGQFLSGRQAVLDTWSGEKHSLVFSMGNVRLNYRSTHPSYCEVMMSFPVTTHFPDGNSITMDQIIHITWCERTMQDMKEKVSRMLVVHISDLYHKHESDNIYPVHFNEVYKGYVPVAEVGKRLYFQGMDASELYLLSNTILWAESTDNGRHSMIHTKDESYRVRASLCTLEKEQPDCLIRCHRCHLVNPLHIIRIRRFSVTLSNGVELSIPEKKYTAFKKKIRECSNIVAETAKR